MAERRSFLADSGCRREAEPVGRGAAAVAAAGFPVTPAHRRTPSRFWRRAGSLRFRTRNLSANESASADRPRRTLPRVHAGNGKRVFRPAVVPTSRSTTFGGTRCWRNGGKLRVSDGLGVLPRMNANQEQTYVPCRRSKAGPTADPLPRPTLVDSEMREFGDEQVRDHTRGRDPLLFSHGHHANHLIAPCVPPPVPLGSCTAVLRNRWFGTVSRFDQSPLRNPPPHSVAACSNAGELVSSVAGNWSWTPR